MNSLLSCEMRIRFAALVLLAAFQSAGAATMSLSTAGMLSFRQASVFPTGDKPTSVAIADVDGDGKNDIIVANSGNGEGTSVGVYRNTTFNGIVSFATAKAIAADRWPYAVAAADLDGDGRADLIVSHFSTFQDGRTSGRVFLYQNTSTIGAIGFGWPVILTNNYANVSVCAADLNNDGRPEVIAGSANGLITILQSEATLSRFDYRSFTNRIELTAPDVDGVVPVDLDGDGRTDLVAYGSGNLTVFQSSLVRDGARPTFYPKVDLTLGLKQVYGVVATDLNGDAKPELAVVENSANLLSVFINESSPGSIVSSSFSNKVAQKFSGGTYPIGIVSDDFDGDGRNDLACGLNESVVVYQNAGVAPFRTNSLARRIELATGASYPWSIAVGDLDGDARPDIVAVNIGNNTLSVFLNTSPSNPARPRVSIQRIDGPALRISIHGKPGRRVLVYSSQDLVAWARFLSLANPTGQIEIDQQPLAFEGSTFFRVLESSP